MESEALIKNSEKFLPERERIKPNESLGVPFLFVGMTTGRIKRGLQEDVAKRRGNLHKNGKKGNFQKIGIISVPFFFIIDDFLFSGVNQHEKLTLHPRTTRSADIRPLYSPIPW